MSEANAKTPAGTRSRISFRSWMVVPLCALGILVTIDLVRIRHVDYVSAVGETPPAGGPGAPARPAWRPRLIVPDHNNASYEWLDQTRQMFARGEWRVRHIEYENAPFGRDVYATSPYRWWLGLLAACDHAVSGRPIGQSLERAALVADPLLHLLLLVGVVLLSARCFGAFPAALLSLGLVLLFPFAAEFLPGAPDDGGLALAAGMASLLLLLAGAGAAFSAAADAGARARRWFFAGGVAGGVALWVSVSNGTPIIAGVAVGALIAAWVERGWLKRNPAGSGGPLPWRAWGFGGAITTLAACLLEFSPDRLGTWQLRAIHPLYGLVWLGGSEVVARLTEWIRAGRLKLGLRDLGGWILGLAAVATLPVAMRLTHNLGFLDVDLSAMQLARLPNGAAAVNVARWIFRDGFSPLVWATVLPLVVIFPAVGLLMRRSAEPAPRSAIAIALGPVLVALGFAARYLSWWNGLDAALLVLLGASTWALRGALHPRFTLWAWSAFAILAVLPGTFQLIPRSPNGARNALNESEVYGLVERDLARWLALHSGREGVVVLAPHNQAYTLYYYGGLHGLATLGWSNLNGLEAAVRIVSASTPEEAKELIDRRGVTYIVIPSWDSYLDSYARMGMGTLEGTFLNRLHYWKLPAWLEPVPYEFPIIAGFEGQSVTILEVVDDQDDAPALSRIAEYFVEMGQLDQAAATGKLLRRFPADVGALAARAQVALARDDATEFAQTLELLRSRLSGGAARALPWDRRVSLAVVLARGKQAELSRKEIQQCLAEINEARLRSLTTGSLYRLQVLVRAFGLPMPDAQLSQLALDLLPDDLRHRLNP